MRSGRTDRQDDGRSERGGIHFTHREGRTRAGQFSHHLPLPPGVSNFKSIFRHTKNFNFQLGCLEAGSRNQLQFAPTGPSLPAQAIRLGPVETSLGSLGANLHVGEAVPGKPPRVPPRGQEGPGLRAMRGGRDFLDPAITQKVRVLKDQGSKFHHGTSDSLRRRQLGNV